MIMTQEIRFLQQIERMNVVLDSLTKHSLMCRGRALEKSVKAGSGNDKGNQ